MVNAFDGKYVARMRGLTSTYGGRVLTSNSFSVNPDTSYDISIYHSIIAPSGSRDNSSDRYSLDLVFFDSSGTEISDPGTFKDFPSTSGEWNEASATVQSPSNASTAKLRVRAREGGTNDPTVYWDQSSVTESSNSTNLLTNPSFESSGGWDFSDFEVDRYELGSAPDPSGNFASNYKTFTTDQLPSNKGGFASNYKTFTTAGSGNKIVKAKSVISTDTVNTVGEFKQQLKTDILNALKDGNSSDLTTAELITDSQTISDTPSINPNQYSLKVNFSTTSTTESENIQSYVIKSSNGIIYEVSLDENAKNVIVETLIIAD